jgi:hypothetical protein
MDVRATSAFLASESRGKGFAAERVAIEAKRAATNFMTVMYGIDALSCVVSN